MSTTKRGTSEWASNSSRSGSSDSVNAQLGARGCAAVRKRRHATRRLASAQPATQQGKRRSRRGGSESSKDSNHPLGTTDLAGWASGWVHVLCGGAASLRRGFAALYHSSEYTLPDVESSYILMRYSLAGTSQGSMSARSREELSRNRPGGRLQVGRTPPASWFRDTRKPDTGARFSVPDLG